MPEQNGRFSFEEICSDAPAVVTFDLEHQLEKKRRKRGGANEHLFLKKAELQCFELILKQLRQLNEKVSRLEMRK